MRVVFIENEDSFSWNLLDALPVARTDVRVIRGRDLKHERAVLDGVECVVVGPGPTDPLRAGIVGVVLQASERKTPMLGVCLGHQALGLAFGATLGRVRPAHGVQETVTFGRSRLLPHFTGPVRVMRYHSLALSNVVEPLRIVARTSDGLPMAIEHEHLPMLGLQFHPDSYGTPSGLAMIADFFGTIA